jgi:hypothetical protein
MNGKVDIEAWIDDRKSFYFFLPDGPHGRPFDSQYVIQDVQQNDTGIVLTFGDDITLRFAGELTLREDGSNLIIARFDKCDFEIKGKIQKSYDAGEVCLSGF